MDDDVPKENLRIFKDFLECSVTYKLSQDYLSEAQKEKVIQCSNRRKDSLHETIGLSRIQYHKNYYVAYTSNDHINILNENRQRNQEVPSKMKQIFHKNIYFKKQGIVSGESCNVIKDKKYPD